MVCVSSACEVLASLLTPVRVELPPFLSYSDFSIAFCN